MARTPHLPETIPKHSAPGPITASLASDDRSMPSVDAQGPTPDSLKAGLTRELAAQLITQQPLAAAGQLGVAAVMVALLWSVTPHTRIATWALLIVVACLVRAVLWYLIRVDREPERHLPVLRLTSTVNALIWGLGAAALIPQLAPQDIALLLLVTCGLVAGATGTLTADLMSFRLFALSLLLPPTLAVLVLGHDRFHLASISLILLFGAFTLLLHRRTYHVLVERLRAATMIHRTRTEGEREHLFLDALFASVPSAIAVVDPTGICLGANPAFETLFGYSIDETMGRPLIDKIVPPERREEALRNQDRVRNGDSVVTETERIRKDGSMVRVQVSLVRVGGDDEGRLLLVYTDVTESRRTEGLVQAAQERLEQVIHSSTAVIYATRV
ncbi:MAG: PAS domain S-box protein, partial [Gemmatimonadota bacterium]